MAALYKVLLGMTILLVITAGCICGWVFLYTGDLPTMYQLSDFAPDSASLAPDSCLAGLSFAIPFDYIGKPFQDALASAEPGLSFSDQIARTLMCNRRGG